MDSIIAPVYCYHAQFAGIMRTASASACGFLRRRGDVKVKEDEV